MPATASTSGRRPVYPLRPGLPRAKIGPLRRRRNRPKPGSLDPHIMSSVEKGDQYGPIRPTATLSPRRGWCSVTTAESSDGREFAIDSFVPPSEPLAAMLHCHGGPDGFGIEHFRRLRTSVDTGPSSEAGLRNVDSTVVRDIRSHPTNHGQITARPR